MPTKYKKTKKDKTKHDVRMSVLRTVFSTRNGMLCRRIGGGRAVMWILPSGPSDFDNGVDIAIDAKTHLPLTGPECPHSVEFRSVFARKSRIGEDGTLHLAVSGGDASIPVAVSDGAVVPVLVRVREGPIKHRLVQSTTMRAEMLLTAIAPGGHNYKLSANEEFVQNMQLEESRARFDRNMQTVDERLRLRTLFDLESVNAK
jgi:hypothetical protein